MHTEHLQNVRPGRVLGGWLVSVAVTSVVVFGLVLLGVMGEPGPRDTAWAITAVAAGFLMGGWFTGYGTLEAPILHGVAVGLTSLVVWAGLNLIMVVAFRGVQWEGLAPGVTASVILTMIVAAVVGCWVGGESARTRAARLGETPGSGVRERGMDP
jgi:hypothetical protein